MLLQEISAASSKQQFVSLVNDLIVELYRTHSTLETMADNGHEPRMIKRHLGMRTSKWFSANFPVLLASAAALKSNSPAFTAISKIKVSALSADVTSLTKQAGFQEFMTNAKAALTSISAASMYDKLRTAYDKCLSVVERVAAEVTPPTPSAKPTAQPNIRGSQQQAVEELVNGMIANLPIEMQHEARRAVSKADNKLKALQAFLSSTQKQGA